MAKNNRQIDLSNLALMIMEIIKQLEQLDEDEMETLEILLDDKTMKVLKETEENPEPISYEEFFKDDLSNHNRQKSQKATSQTA